jgi:hypothetical protein
MNQEQRNCQNCKQNFEITLEDFAFYEKIKVPPPTWCPECRVKRRLQWRNERTLWKREANNSGKTVVSMIPPGPHKVYEYDYWISDNWDGTDYGKEIDFSRPFLEQVGELAKEVPWCDLLNVGSVNSQYCHDTLELKNGYLSFDSGYGEHLYYVTGTHHSNYCFDLTSCTYCERSAHNFDCHNSYNIFYSSGCRNCNEVFFSKDCVGCSNCFGCVGLRSKQYCILNKQYTKEEYESMIPKIIAHMNAMPYKDSRGRLYSYGEFLPPELSPFSYNESIAREYFPLSKEEVIEQGFLWRDPEEKNHHITLKNIYIPDSIRDANDSILKESIECAHKGQCNEQCTIGFKIIPQELTFYKESNIALPRLCPNCRHGERLEERNLFRFYKRKCQCAGKNSDNGTYANQAVHFHNSSPCPNEFETSYAPDRTEIVYCEQCYQTEIV